MNYIAMPGFIKQFRLPTHAAQRKGYIIDAVCQYYGMTTEQIFKRSRARDILDPRRILTYLLRKDAQLNLKHIADMFAQDHTTVIHTCKTIENDLATHDPTILAIRTIRSLYP
jgi:chromosomal replication initiation ATPase DnaA